LFKSFWNMCAAALCSPCTSYVQNWYWIHIMVPIKSISQNEISCLIFVCLKGKYFVWPPFNRDSPHSSSSSCSRWYSSADQETPCCWTWRFVAIESVPEATDIVHTLTYLSEIPPVCRPAKWSLVHEVSQPKLYEHYSPNMS